MLVYAPSSQFQSLQPLPLAPVEGAGTCCVVCGQARYYPYVPPYRGALLHDSGSSLSSITALTTVKSRSLLSIETEGPLSKYEASPGVSEANEMTHPASSKALVPVKAESTTAMTFELEERIKKWKMRVRGKGEELPAQQIPSVQSGCSCPIGNNSRNNLTTIRL